MYLYQTLRSKRAQFFPKLNERSELVSIITNSGRHRPGRLWIFGGKKNSQEENIYIYGKNELAAKLSCDVVHLFIALLNIEISFDLYLVDGSESIETHTLANNVKLFNECITRK